MTSLRATPLAMAAAGAALFLVACTTHGPEPSAPNAAAATQPAPELTEAEKALLLTLSPKPPVPPDPTNRVADDPCAARLGQRLFYDARLSSNGLVSCASCHDPQKALTDGLPLGHGVGTTARHVPTIWNSAYNRWWFWDGRADSAWAQVLGPIENPVEHGGSRVRCARVVAEDKVLRAEYEHLFGPLPAVLASGRLPADARPDPWLRWRPEVLAWNALRPDDREAISRVHSNLGKALASFVRRLAGGTAPFDRFVAALRSGDPAGLDAIPASAKRGAALFVGKARCTLCHRGPMLSDLEFHDLHLVSAVEPPRDTGRFRGIELVRRDEFNALGPFADGAEATPRDKVRYLVQQPENWGQFKTPSLRNVDLTPPYMHDGRFATLHDVLHYYRTFEGAVPPTSHGERTLQRVDLTDAEEGDLIAFLGTLNDFAMDPALAGPPADPEPEQCR